MPFNDIFGGNTIYPASPTLLRLALAANVELQWPLEQNMSGEVLAAIIDVTPAGAGLSITMPDARIGSTGYVTTFYNAGADTYSVLNATGGALLTVASGEAWNVYLLDNATEAGIWRIFEMGAGTSTANAATLAGAGLEADGTTLNEEMRSSAHAVDYVILDADRADVQTWTGGTGIFTLPDPAAVGIGWFVPIKNNGTGSLTVTASSGTVDGSASLILATLDSGFFVSDGTNFWTVGLGQEVNSVFDFISLPVGGSGDFTLTGAQLNRVAYELTGNLTGNRNIIVPASVQQYWVNNSTTGAFTLTVKTAAQVGGVVVPQGQRTILYSDGTNVVNAETILVSTPVTVTQGGTGLTTIAQGDLLYGSNIDAISALPKNTTATRYLSNTGSSNNPAWAQVSLSNGITGTLGIGNGGTNAVTANAALNNLLPVQTALGGRFLQTDGTNTSWEAQSAVITASGTFTGTLTGMSGATTGDIAYWVLGGALAILVVDAGVLTGTSDTTAMTMTGLPAAVQPAGAVAFPIAEMIDNGVTGLQGEAAINGGSGTINFAISRTDLTANFVRASTTGFTASGTKGLGATVFIYPLL